MDLLVDVTQFLRKRNVRAYLVGGVVRDQLLGRIEIRDVDLAIDGDAIGLARAFANARGGAFYLMDEEHQVARVILGERTVDFARLRGDLTNDLATRDFTINAMARPLSGTALAEGEGLIDPFHGRADYEARQIRAVSESSFQDDPVRLLRALRLAGELGLAIEPQTLALIRRDAPRLSQASMERARDELIRILQLPEADRWLSRAADYGLLQPLLPEVALLAGVDQPSPHTYDALQHSIQVVREVISLQAKGYADVAGGGLVSELNRHFGQVVSAGRTRAVLLRLTALLHDIGKASTKTVDESGITHFYGHEGVGALEAEEVLRRLRFSNDEIEIAATVVAGHLRPEQLAGQDRVTNRAVYRLFRDSGSAGVDVVVLAVADRRGKAATARGDETEVRLQLTARRLLESYFHQHDEIVNPPALVDGRTLIRELNLQPGRRVGRLLEAIREAQAEGEVSSSAEAIALARKMLEPGEGAPGDSRE